MLANTPRSSKFFKRSFARTSSFSASSRMVMPSVIVTSRGGRGAAQMVETVVHPVHRDRQIAVGMSVPAQVAADASAVQGAGRSDANLGCHQEVVRDCPSAAGHDFLWAVAEPGPQVLQVLRD